MTQGQGKTEKRERQDRPDEAGQAWILTVTEGPDAGKTFTLDETSATRVLLGTSPVCTMRLGDPQVSRRHAAFEVAGGHLQLMELGSTNGTTVNGVVIKEASLRGGEALRVGATVLSVHPGAQYVANLGTTMSFGRVLGESIPMRRLYASLQRLASVDHAVLIEGESGTGKELVAEEIHAASKRKDAPFVVLESSALPHKDLSAELFGAPGGEPGLIARAEGGVLFVDEVGDLTRLVQKNLRAALQNANVRLVAATRRDLDRDVTAGRFDDAFFFDLAAGRIELPPLRDRPGDVVLLARHFWTELARTMPDAATELPMDLLPRFEEHPWAGNVRELRALVLRRMTLGEVSRTHHSDLARTEGSDFIEAVIKDDLAFPAARDRVVSEFERRYVERVLARHGGNVTAAAHASGVAHRYFQLVRARLR